MEIDISGGSGFGFIFIIHKVLTVNIFTKYPQTGAFYYNADKDGENWDKSGENGGKMEIKRKKEKGKI